MGLKLQGTIGNGNHHLPRFGCRGMVGPQSKEGTLVRFQVKVSARNAAVNRSGLVPSAPHGPTMSVNRWRAPRNAVVAVAAVFILTVCQSRRQHQTPVSSPINLALSALGSGQQRMTMMQNGKPCEMFIMNNGGGIGGGKIATPWRPMVRQVFGSLYEATVISYVPAHDYVGRD